MVTGRPVDADDSPDAIWSPMRCQTCLLLSIVTVAGICTCNLSQSLQQTELFCSRTIPKQRTISLPTQVNPFCQCHLFFVSPLFLHYLLASKTNGTGSRQPDPGAASAGPAPAAPLGGGLLRPAHRGERLGTDGAHRGLGGAQAVELEDG